MFIIGHRGAAGIEPENTIPSIEAAVREGVDMIEFDVRITRDGKLVAMHDANLLRIAGENKNIAHMTFDEINLIATHSGHPIPSFREALEAANGLPVLIDCKGKGWAEAVHRELKGYKGPAPSVTASDTNEMFRFSQLRPDCETYISELFRPFESLHDAKSIGFTGVSMIFWIINPIAYYYARRNKLKLMIFTINSPFLARLVHIFYPKAMIITNVPDKLAPLAKRRRGKAKD